MDSATLSVIITALETPIAPLRSNQVQTELQYGKVKLSAGSGAGEVNQVFGDAETLAASGTTTYDLHAFNGATDELDNAYALTRIVALLVINNGTDPTALLTVKQAASNGFATLPTAAIVVQPGGCLLLTGPSAAAMAAGATTGEIELLNGSSTATLPYQIIVLGS